MLLLADAQLLALLVFAPGSKTAERLPIDWMPRTYEFSPTTTPNDLYLAVGKLVDFVTKRWALSLMFVLCLVF